MHLVMLPPVVTDADRALVARQLGREPRTLRRVAVRCPFGAPAVTEQSPYGADGEPFPTMYYLTCRHLVTAVSRLEAANDDRRRYRQLLELLDLVLDELRRRIGQTYTLAELVVVYGESERWAREVLEERAAVPGWPRDLTVVLAAAFDAYQRGAIDYEP